MTPLMLAATEGRIDVLHLLLERKAVTDLRDYTGRTALMWARRTGKRTAIRILEDAGIRE